MKKTFKKQYGSLRYVFTVIIDDRNGSASLVKEVTRKDLVNGVRVTTRLDYTVLELDKEEVLHFLKTLLEWRNGNGTDD